MRVQVEYVFAPSKSSLPTVRQHSFYLLDRSDTGRVFDRMHSTLPYVCQHIFDFTNKALSDVSEDDMDEVRLRG